MTFNEKAIGKIGDRFEIRRLTTQDTQWAAALGIFSNHFYSPLWTKVFPENPTYLTYSISTAVEPLFLAIAKHGLCLGVFDTKYKFKRAESEAIGGKLYWDRQNLNKSREDLEEEMDFPLVHIALSFSAKEPPSVDVMKGVFEAMPLWAWFDEEFEKQANTEKAKYLEEGDNPAPEKVLKRCGTSTRSDYMGKGIMRACSEFHMGLAKSEGFAVIDIDSAHPSVTKVWMNPLAPFHAKFISALRPEIYATKSGERAQEFSRSGTSLDRIRVFL